MAEKKNEVATTKSAKPEKGRGGTRNFPTARPAVDTEEKKAAVAQLLSEVNDAYHREKVKNDEELAKRFEEYFNLCAKTGQVPTVEEMCLCTGYALSTIWDWENGRRHGFSDKTAEIIKKAKDFLKTFDAKMAVASKMDPVVYFFRAKNYYGMVDKQEVVLTPNQNPEDYSVEEIRKQYLLEDSATMSDSSTVSDYHGEPSDFPEGSSDS